MNGYYYIGISYKERNLMKQAIDSFKKVIELQAEHTAAQDQLVEIYGKQGSNDKIIEILEKAKSKQLLKNRQKEIEKRTGKTTRHVVLGHVQRGGPPVAFDISFGIRLGIAAVDLVKKGKFDSAVVLKGIKIASVKLEKVVEKNRTLKKDLLKLTDFFSMM